ncbi:hypothetical protein [Actinocatenispora sera]|uniref:FtsX-like permease family protein n=1 Tax=Actinocatenispora sera TaxID=390989 RepID=A0A810L6Z2_9ACTN|nr:hypothetical protein [Actinocatenispora sera]BCJ31284.1 hypothetical protein Asera_53920 [Actinocatenispora sera]
MAAVGVTVRGIRYRAGRSLVVFVLAVVATTAVVLVPGYTLAAEQSALTDQLRSRPAASLGLTVSGDEPDTLDATADGMLRDTPRLAAVTGRRWSGASGTVSLASQSGLPDAALVYRSGLCGQLRLTAGHCPSSHDTGLLAEAGTARRYGLSVGDTVRFQRGDDDPKGEQPGRYRHRIVGLYRLPDAGATYWWGGGLFGTLDAEPLLSTNPRSVAFPGLRDQAAEVDIEVLPDRISLADAAPLRTATVDAGVAVEQAGSHLSTALPAAIGAAGRDRGAILSSVPVVVVPLVLLCLFVLYLAVAAVTEERGPEIALAKLRGFGGAGAARFGLAETLLVIVLAVPVGLLAGLGGTELLAALVLAPGTHVALSLPVLAAAGLALLGAAAAATVAARHTVRAAPLALLRRVPARGRWRANVLEGAIAALAAAALYQVLSDPGSQVGLLAPPLIALVVGLAAARLTAVLAGRRRAAGAGRVRPYRLLARAQLARRPLAQRLVLAVTVAVALLGFAVVATDVAAHNRSVVAADRVGAHAVYTVRAGSAQQLLTAVRRVDPGGHGLMAAMQTSVHYGDGTVSVLAVDSGRLPAAATWPGRAAGSLRSMVAALPSHTAAPLAVRGPFVATVRVDDAPTGAHALTLTAQVADAAGAARTVQLGTLRAGTHPYSATLPGCARGCDLVGLGIARYPGDATQVRARLAITALTDHGAALDAGLGTDGRWRAMGADSGFTLEPSTSDGLVLGYAGEQDADALLGYASVPRRLPAVLAGPAPADDPHATRFAFPALGGTPIPFTVVGHDREIPRAGRHALLTDLTGLQRLVAITPDATADATPTYEVWAGPDAPSDLPARLAAAGVPVTGTATLAGEQHRLARQAPGLALHLYLVAGVAAVLLALGAVLLSCYAGAATRRYETAALAVAGVPAAELRRALRTEFRAVLGIPLLAGLAAGAVGAALLLPVIKLVTATDAGVHRSYALGPFWLPGAVLAAVAVMVAVTVVATRLLERIEPVLLRGGAR